MNKKKVDNVTATRKTNCNNLFVLSKRLLANRLRSKTFDPNNYKIVYMGDSWASAGNFTGVAVLNEALNVSRNTKPLLILHGGDTVFTGSKEQLNFFAKKVKSRVPGTPLFVAVGNHESTFSNGIPSSLNNFKKIIGPKALHFAFQLPFVKVIGVSSVSPQGGRPYGLSPSELNFLRQQLNTKAKNIIIFTHVPPEEWQQGREEFARLIQKKNVTLLLFSHVHAYRKFKVNNKTAIISGGAGAALDKNQINHIVILTVRNGKITTKKVPITWDLGGSTID